MISENLKQKSHMVPAGIYIGFPLGSGDGQIVSFTEVLWVLQTIKQCLKLLE